MKQILLFKTAQGWMSKNLVNGQPDTEILALFGTCELPTAYTSQASAETVLTGIKALNPNAQVTVIN